MDKMFYNLQEVCQKLGKSEDEVREMVSSGQLQEFRDKDELVFKVEQINLLTGVDEDSGDVVLDLSGTDHQGGTASELDLTGGTGTGTGSGLDLSGNEMQPTPGGVPAQDDTGSIGLTGAESAMGLSGSGDAAGLSAFDTSAGIEGEGGEDAAATRVGDGMDDDLTLESVGSGSGLLDLTRESDDTSLGAELLEEVYSSDDDNFEIPANASGLFEAASPDETELAGAAISEGGLPMPAGGQVAVAQGAYDGSGSGLGVGAAIGGTIALVILMIIMVVELEGSTSDLAMIISENLWIWTGGLVGVAALAILAGMFIGKASE